MPPPPARPPSSTSSVETDAAPQRVAHRDPPVVPASVEMRPAHSAGAVPYSARYGDVYHAAAGAWAQARHVFLGGNGLPERWQGRDRFVILETGFGLGNNFLATWAAWRADSRRCQRLVFISIEKHPLTREDLRRVHAGPAETGRTEEAGLLADKLCRAWPPLTPGVHVLDFDEPGQAGAHGVAGVTLMLALGDIADVLPGLLASVDAFYLDGFAPARNPQMWDGHLLGRLGRWAAPGATAATWSAARGVRDALAAAGFEVHKEPGFGGKRDMVRARHTPRFAPPAPCGGLWPQPEGERHVAIVGAGLAGCAAAWALTREGWRVTLLDRHAAPAQEASGNPAGLFHAIVHGEDGVHARAHRAAALMTAATASAWIDAGRVAGSHAGLLRLDGRMGAGQAAALLHDQALPAGHVRWLDRDEARQVCGLDVPHGGWLFGQAGWLDPAGYARAFLDEARQTGLLNWVGSESVTALSPLPAGGGWQILGKDGVPLLQAPRVVLANATAALALAGTLRGSGADTALPLTAVRGQITWLPPDSGIVQNRPVLPVAGGGYVLTLPDGSLLCGATTRHDDAETRLREDDHRHNLAQAARLGAAAWMDEDHSLLPPGLQGRAGWRAVTPDRLPLVGALPMAPPDAAAPWPDQVRRVPRLRDGRSGVFVLTGLGSRGITWAALGGRLLAHWITGGPCPVEAPLRDALDPARFAVRRQRLRSARGQ